MYADLQDKVLEERHKFKPVKSELIALASQTETLGLDCFKAKPANRSLPFHQVVSTGPVTTWWSPKASNLPEQFVDQVLVTHLVHDREAVLRCLARSWLGQVADVRHNLVVKAQVFGSSGKSWVLAASLFSGSACLGVPVRLVDLAGTELRFFEIDVVACRDSCFFLIDSINIESCTIRWRSWARQCTKHPALAAFRPALRAFVRHGFAPLKIVASLSCWWTMSRTCLVRVAAVLGADVDSSSNFFDFLMCILETALPDNIEEDLVRIVRTRLHNEKGRLAFSDELFEIQEAIDFLDQHDKKLVTEQKKTVVHCETSYNALKKEFSARVQTIRDKKEAAAKAAAKVAPKAKGRARAAIAPKPKFNFDITHAEARTYIPPDTSIWRGLTRCQWWGHCEPNPKIVTKWSEHGGEKGAMIACIRQLWQEHLALHGLDASACPWSDLLRP